MLQYLTNLLIGACLPLLVIMLIFALVFFLLTTAKKSWEKKYREPFHEELLRPPGWGCLKRREDAVFDIAAIAVALPSLWAIVALLALHGDSQSSIGTAIAVFITTIFLIRSLCKRTVDARTAYLGYLGEWAVAESLEPLTRNGWKIFHDFQMHNGKNTYNIDHIAIGPTGIFAIETKARSQQVNLNHGSNKAQVVGEVVILPNGTRLKSLRTTKGYAAALRDWLQSRGVRVRFVNPIVVLPGWNVCYPKENASRNIRDPRNLAAYIMDQSENIDSATISQAIEEIDKHCRSLKFANIGF